MATLSPIHKLKLASLAQAQEREEIFKSHIEDSELLSLASGILGKILHTFFKGTPDSPSGLLKSLINSVSSHFVSFESSRKVRISNDFNDKRFSELKKMIANDTIFLDTYVKRIQNVLSEGDVVYKSCLSSSKFVEDIENKI